jgi:raffinose/stachyose/melibiose transport system substrate-binding protein
MRTRRAIMQGFLVLILLLVSLDIGATGQQQTKKVTVIRTLDRSSGEPYNTAMKTLVDQFQAKYPNISVKRTTVSPSPSEAEIAQKTALASSEPPDAMDCMGRAYLQTMQPKGILRDVTTEVKKWGWFAPGTLEQAEIAGKIWGVPVFSQDKYLGYNKTLFKKYGLTVADDWSWQDFMTIGEKLKAQGIVPIAEGAEGADRWASLNWINVLNQQLVGLKRLRTDMDVTTGAWTDPGYAKAANLMKELIQKDFFGGNPVAVSHPTGQARFYMGKAGMMYMGSWDIAGMFAETGGIAPKPFVNDVEIFEDFPHDPSWPGERRAHQNYAIIWGIPKNAQHPDEALLFLKFFSDPSDTGGAQNQTRITQDMSASKIPTTLLKIPQMQRYAALNAKASGTFLFLDQGSVADVWENYSRELENFLGGKIDAQELMKRVQTVAATARQQYSK